MSEPETTSSAPPRSAYATFAGAIDLDAYNRIVPAFSQLVREGFNDLHLLLFSNGGGVGMGIAIYNVLRSLSATVVTYNVGNIDSIANVVFLAGDRRYSAPAATFMFHGVSWNVEDSAIAGPKAREVVANIQADEDRIAMVIAERTRLSLEDIQAFFAEAATKDAAFAKSVGIVDDVVQPVIPDDARIVNL